MKDQANQKRYRALIPVANGNEDLEVIAMIDVLRRADIEVVIASINNEDTVTLMKGSRLVVDAPLLNVVQQEWDLINVYRMGSTNMTYNVNPEDHWKVTLIIRLLLYSCQPYEELSFLDPDISEQFTFC